RRSRRPSPHRKGSADCRQERSYARCSCRADGVWQPGGPVGRVHEADGCAPASCKEKGPAMIDPGCATYPAVQIDIQRIMEMIPHRHPFLMIDKVVDVVANQRATGVKYVSIDEYYFKGHFPARPVMPGVLIIEAMAQTAAVLVVHTLGPESEGKL